MTNRLKISCSKDNLKNIRDFVTGALKNQGLDEVELNNLVLAVDEVSANLIIHSHACNPNDYFDLIIRKDKNGVSFEFIDRGVGFDIEEYKSPSIQEIVSQKKKGGVGLILVRRIMDDIDFRNDGNKCVCRLFKKID
jgi:serine/threonine-protein kinase RsbW